MYTYTSSANTQKLNALSQTVKPWYEKALTPFSKKKKNKKNHVFLNNFFFWWLSENLKTVLEMEKYDNKRV